MMVKRKFILILFLILGVISAVSGSVIIATRGLENDNSDKVEIEKIIADKLNGYEANVPDGAVLKLIEKVLAESRGGQRVEYRLILANEIYRKADGIFWEFLKAGRRPAKSQIPDLYGNLALYEKYIGELDRITILKEKEIIGREALWQVWNNKGNAKIYEIFLGFLLKDDSKKLEKLAKSALADYSKAYDLCGQNKDCANFVAQNIDFLTRFPPKNKNQAGEEQPGGGLGNLFQKGDSGQETTGSGDDKDNRPKIVIPGTSPGKSIKGAH